MSKHRGAYNSVPELWQCKICLFIPTNLHIWYSLAAEVHVKVDFSWCSKTSLRQKSPAVQISHHPCAGQISQDDYVDVIVRKSIKVKLGVVNSLLSSMYEEWDLLAAWETLLQKPNIKSKHVFKIFASWLRIWDAWIPDCQEFTILPRLWNIEPLVPWWLNRLFSRQIPKHC
jgi:hypothetical protein